MTSVMSRLLSSPLVTAKVAKIVTVMAARNGIRRRTGLSTSLMFVSVPRPSTSAEVAVTVPDGR